MVLALKIVAAVGMVFLARDLGTRMGRRVRAIAPAGGAREPSLSEVRYSQSGWRRLLSPSRLILVIGLVAFFLSALLVHVYESDVAGIA